MPKYVCRIRHRKGEPLGLNIYPSVTFLDLPLEIRDRIYQDLLVSPRPILVFSGQHHESLESHNGREIMTAITTIEPVDSILQELTLGLLSCSRQIAAEAAASFYRCNTFKFEGHDVWQPLYGFLRLIGDRNTNHLRDLEVGVDRLVEIQADRYGLRTEREHKWLFGNVYPRCSSETGPIDNFYERIVETASPAIRYCFRALGKNGPPLTLKMVMERGSFPFADPWLLSVQEAVSWLTYEKVPELVERFCGEYTSEQVTVIWLGSIDAGSFRKREGDLEGLGWEVIEAEESEISAWGIEPNRVVDFKLRRRKMAAHHISKE